MRSLTRHGIPGHGIPSYGIQGKMTRRLAGIVIGTQGLAVFFGALVARALAAATGSRTSGTFLLIGSLLAVLCILDAGLMRRPWGLTLGWVLQVATLACALIVPAMLIVGLLFSALWVTVLVQGRRMDEHSWRVDAQWEVTREPSATGTSATEPSATGTSATGTSATGTSATGTSATEPSTHDG